MRVDQTEQRSPVLRVEDVTVEFRTGRGIVEAVAQASLTVMPGETVAIVGQSGSGKSTLTAAINRLLPPNGSVTAGSISLQGRDLLALSERQMNDVRGSEIGLVPQDPMSNLNPLMPVGKQIAEIFALNRSARGRAAKLKAIELLDMVGIPDATRRYSQYPHEFSGGMRQRALIAMGLACRPTLLIADEPTSALDVTIQKSVLDQLAELTASMGTAVILVTHDLALAAERADRVAVMNRGRIVETGAAELVLSNPSDEYTKRLLAAAPSFGTTSLIGGVSDTADDDDIMSVQGLSKRFGYRRGWLGRGGELVAVDGVSFAIPRGKTVGIVGESGSGKSTTARMLLQLEPSSAGSFEFDGAIVTGFRGKDLMTFRRRVQPVFQNPYAALDPRYTIGEAVREPLEVHKVGTKSQRQARVEEVLEQVALDPILADRYPHELSGGQRQRVAIARALSLKPDVVVLDEAVSALDVLVQAQILDLLVQLQRELGLTYVFISHDLAVVRMICHVVHVMREGRIVESGTPTELFDHPRHDYTKALLSAIPGGPQLAASSDHPA